MKLKRKNCLCANYKTDIFPMFTFLLERKYYKKTLKLK